MFNRRFSQMNGLSSETQFWKTQTYMAIADFV
jgi:hypothetical protein